MYSASHSCSSPVSFSNESRYGKEGTTVQRGPMLKIFSEMTAVRVFEGSNKLITSQSLLCGPHLHFEYLLITSEQKEHCYKEKLLRSDVNFK